jgi:hypothetical protein
MKPLFIIGLASLALSAPDYAQIPAPPLPRREARPWIPTQGILESFLAKTKNAVVIKRPLGRLTGLNQTKAIFAAVVASDPLDTTVKVKGLEIQLEEGKRRVTVYLDDDRAEESGRDSLKEFQDELAHLADKGKLLEHWQNHNPMATEWATTAQALNRPAALPEYCCPRNTVFSAGWYRREEELGVTMDPDWPLGSFYFPKVTLSEVVEIVQSGRAFLDGN